MKFNFRSYFKPLAFALSIMIVAASCTGPKNEKEISMLYANWAEGIAMTHLAKVALEEHGYVVKIKAIDPGPIYASLAKGDGDVFVDAWLPNTHSAYWKRFGKDIEILGTSFDDATTGLAVPAYVTINSIDELNQNADKFEGKIIGIDSGSGIHASTEKVIKEYGLDFNQVTSSEPAMLAALRKAYNANEWIVITAWKPHLKWSQYELKYLEDPKEIYPLDECKVVARKGFKNEFPEVAGFFNNFEIQEDQLYELIGIVLENTDRIAAVEKWYLDNKAMVDGWWPKDVIK
jgi:glycine betaine/proline transport system substrate-binding protein